VTGCDLRCGDAGDVLRTLPDASARTCVTSPPYWGLRDYGVAGQVGLEATLEEYVEHLVDAFREVRRVLADDGTLWLVLGDRHAAAAGKRRDEELSARWHGKHYLGDKQGEAARTRPGRPTVEGLKPKDLVGLPWHVAFALRADGWYLRSDVVWQKPNAMPESVLDRPTMSHEHVFLLAKSKRYYYDADAVREPYVEQYVQRVAQKVYDAPSMRRDRRGNMHKKYYAGTEQGNPLGRNKRDVWTIPSRSFKGAHFATFPPALVEVCVRAGSATGDVVLDPFAGSGTVGVVAKRLGRGFLGIDLNFEYVEMARRRIESEVG
jgi:DNA modification methylase